jgi:transposase-like protein
MPAEKELGKAVVSVTQNFLLSAAARTLSLETVMRMSEKEARQAFARIRWHERNGTPACSRCGCEELYICTAEKLWKCKGCGYRFSLTSGTIFASRKLPFRDMLVAIAMFANGDKKHSAMQLSRDLDVQYRTAFLLSHKIRDSVNGGKNSSKTDDARRLPWKRGERYKPTSSIPFDEMNEEQRSQEISDLLHYCPMTEDEVYQILEMKRVILWRNKVFADSSRSRERWLARTIVREELPFCVAALRECGLNVGQIVAMLRAPQAMVRYYWMKCKATQPG